MAYTNYTQRFVQATPEILIEYDYSNLISPDTMSVSFTRIVNSLASGQVQLLNPDSAVDTTGNVQERSALQISAGKFADLDKDDIPTYLAYQENLGNITTSTVTGSNVPYDRVRIHLLSGYNFEDKDGVIIQIRATERSGKELVYASLAFLKDSDFFEFNAKPIWLGDRFYDRYFDVKIPSTKLINDTFYSLEGNVLQSSSFVALITSNGLGFLRAQPLHISVTEIKSTDLLKVAGARYNIYNIGTTKTVALNQADEFSLFSAVVQPASNGKDYFEYFGSWNGGFIEDFILNANSLPGNNYIVLHEIRLYEQIGSLYTQTDLQQSIQEEDFDKPKRFRPTLLNADTAVSFTLEYTCRLYNKADASQIIRTASYTSLSPKDWGEELPQLKLLNAPEPYKIYNKVVDGPTIVNEAFVQSSAEVVPFTTKYVPSFFDRFTVNLTQDTIMLDKDGQLVAEKTTDTKPVFGQGDCNIVINPFDNFLRFTILKVSGNDIPIPLDLGSSATYYLVFINDSEKKMRFPAFTDSVLGDPTKGDVLFKIPEADAEKVLTFTTKEFYIVSRFSDGTETMLYQGKFNTPENIQEVKSLTENVKVSQSAKIEQSIREIVVKQEELQAQADVIKVSAPIQSENITPGSVIVEIPGLSNDSVSKKKISIISSIKPKSEQKKTTATKATEQKLKKQAEQKKANS